MEKKALKFDSSFFINNAIYIILLVLLLIIGLVDMSFFNLSNLSAIITQSCTRTIFALGVAGIIVLGGTDLSAGRLIGLAAVVCCSMLQSPEYARRVFVNMPQIPVFVPILLSMVICALFSFLHCLTVNIWGVAPFIASLGFQEIAYGFCSLYYRIIVNSTPIAGLDERLKSLTSNLIVINGVPVSKLIMFALIVSIIVWIIWNKMTLGQNMFAIGGNKEAAKVCGVNIVLNSSIIYIIAGLLYGLGGALEGARTGSATNALGATYAMDAIAACVAGGVSMRGGTGTVSGVIIGVIVFQVINYGLIFIGMSPDIQYIVKGAIIIVAVAIDARKYRTVI